MDGPGRRESAAEPPADRLWGLLRPGFAERPQHPPGRVAEPGGRVGCSGHGGAVGAAQVVARERGAAARRHEVSSAGTGEHQRSWRAAVGELPGDRLGDRTSQGNDADAGRALGPVLVAAAEPARLVADLDHLQAPAAEVDGEVDAVGAKAEQLARSHAGADQGDEVVAEPRRGVDEQLPNSSGVYARRLLRPSLAAASTGGFGAAVSGTGLASMRRSSSAAWRMRLSSDRQAVTVS